MSTTIGYYVTFGVVLLPVYMMLIGWFTGRPRRPDTALLGIGYILSLAVAILIGLWIMGLVLSMIMGL